MDKQHLIKMIIFFSFTFVVILTLMTVILGIFYSGSGEPAGDMVASSDTLAVVDSVVQKEKELQPEDPQKTVDSLQSLLSEMRTEKRKLEEQASVEAKTESTPKPQSNKKAREVAKIYEKMDPAEAAKILSGLKSDMAVAIIANMKKRQAAKVLASMEPQTAVIISRKLVQYN